MNVLVCALLCLESMHTFTCCKSQCIDWVWCRCKSEVKVSKGPSDPSGLRMALQCDALTSWYPLGQNFVH